MKKRKKRRIIILTSVLSVTILLGIYFLYFTSSKKEEKGIFTALSVKKIVEESQGAIPQLTGEVIPNAMSKINVDNTKGVVSEVHVKVGDKVKKGQKLFSYDNPENALALKEGETEIAKIQNKLQLNNQTLNKKAEQLEVKRNQENELNAKINNTNELENEDLEQELQLLTEEIQGIESEIDTLKNEQSDGQLDLDNAQTNQEMLKEKQNQEEVVSSVEGIVKKIDEEQINTSVSNGSQVESFIEIMDTSSLKVKGKVDELKKDKLVIGQPVMIVDRKNQEKTWEGKINRIDDIAMEEEEDSGLSKYPFEIQVEGDGKKPNIGNHVYVQPQMLEEKELKLPSSFIFKQNKKTYIWKVKDGKAMKQEVILGKVDKESGKTEIKDGLTLKDQILMPTSNLREGTEVIHD